MTRRPAVCWVVVLALLVAPWPALRADAAEADTPPGFSLALSAIAYIIDEQDDYLCPILYVDRGRLHLEARWQYEDRNTASLWAGVNWGGGGDFWWELTPMAGLVLGDTDGAAPGLEASLGYRSFTWYAEVEYLVDLHDSDDNFFYAWSELYFAAGGDWRLGLVSQRTRVYESGVEIDRGLLVGVEFGAFEATVYVFNPEELFDTGDDAPVLALQAGVEF